MIKKILLVNEGQLLAYDASSDVLLRKALLAVAHMRLGKMRPKEPSPFGLTETEALEWPTTSTMYASWVAHQCAMEKWAEATQAWHNIEQAINDNNGDWVVQAFRDKSPIFADVLQLLTVSHEYPS